MQNSMKNIGFLFAFLVFLTLLSACEEEPFTPSCSICGLYSGSINGVLEVPLTSTDTSFSGIPSTVQVSETQTINEYAVSLDISALVGSPPGTSTLNVDGALSGSTLAIPNQAYDYAGLSYIGISGSLDFTEVDAISGSFNIEGGAIGGITFIGTK